MEVNWLSVWSVSLTVIRQLVASGLSKEVSLTQLRDTDLTSHATFGCSCGRYSFLLSGGHGLTPTIDEIRCALSLAFAGCLPVSCCKLRLTGELGYKVAPTSRSNCS